MDSVYGFNSKCSPRLPNVPFIDEIRVVNGEFVDSYNRERYFHGINNVIKGI